MGWIEGYLGGKTIQEIADLSGCSYTKVRNMLLKNNVELRRVGQQYILPDRSVFVEDCSKMRWRELEKKYGVSWSIIKYWKRRYGLTDGRKHDRMSVYDEEGDCWRCSSHKSGKGYPRCKGGKLVVVRNWEDKNGVWPKGMLARHLCANSWCVNPNHIVPGTTFENIVDAILDGRSVKYHPLKRVACD